MDNLGKVTGVSKSNYKALVNRAAEVKAEIARVYEETNGKPSLRFLQSQFNMSTKALQRHVRIYFEKQGLDSTNIPTTTQLARPGPKTQQVQQVQATDDIEIVEESDDTSDTGSQDTDDVEVPDWDEIDARDDEYDLEAITQ